MDGVLEGATVLCVCKLAASLVFLPSVSASFSPVSYCCCCLLIFTDFLVTVYLGLFWLSELWLTELTPVGDIIALRFLLFISHTYGAVLLLTTPLIAVETLVRLLWHQDISREVAGSDGQHVEEVKAEEEEEGDVDKQRGLSHVISYLCCLSVWVVVALNVRWRWKLEEVWTAACLHTTNSLIRCLPNMFSPMLSVVNPCWVMVFLYLLLLIVTTSTGLHGRQQAAQTTETHSEKQATKKYSNSCWPDLVPPLSAASKPVSAGMSVPELAQSVDPGKTESSCSVHSAYSWNSMQMSARLHGDFGLHSPGCLSVERAGHEHQSTKTATPLTFINEELVDSQYGSLCGWRQWGFPCLGVNVMTGCMCVLSIFVLPLNLSVNIVLIRTIETLMELCVKTLVSLGNTSSKFMSHNEAVV
ncbi:uncharacterized protein LOC115419381 [Sphaeramia orbicularis]|uniref:uncharacterized protein LOC115419381 n=1 Tax=Sphaeramia orbicularis TaxID=375764 RepID=UPI00117C654F|nr:uncharacterized protein LOC115419381 [Sphaeramia orbicularis]